jgi:hypothetical protein
MLVTMFKRTCRFTYSGSQESSPNTPFMFLQIHFNIIPASMRKPSKRCFLQTRSVSAIWPTQRILHNLVTPSHVFQPPLSSVLLVPSILFKILLLKTQSLYIHFLVSETKFHSHTNQQAKL